MINTLRLTQTNIMTPLGKLVALTDNTAVYFLAFEGTKKLERKIERITQGRNATQCEGATTITNLLEKELHAYFADSARPFTIPVHVEGTPFQQQVWQELMRIPSGQTRSYAQLAAAIGNPKACRAVAQANGANAVSLIIPCHRVINANGSLGGYAGGCEQKQWLLQHEGVVIGS